MGTASAESATSASLVSTGAASNPNGVKAIGDDRKGNNDDSGNDRARGRSRSRSNDKRGAASSGRPAAETPIACEALDIAEVSINGDLDDALSVITGTMSEPEIGDEDMEEVVAQIPTEQRANVRALLEVRRCRRARGIQRHAKPEAGTAAKGPKK